MTSTLHPCILRIVRDWYRLDVNEIFEELKTSPLGLTSDEAKFRLNLYGHNRLPEEEKIGIIRVLLHQFASPLIYILMISGIISILLGELVDSIVIFSVVIINAIVGFTQEYKAEKSIRALKKVMIPRARVIRDGKHMDISSEELVKGDVVLLYSGIRVPADMRLFETVELKIDESILTGESVPSEKHKHRILEDSPTYGDQRNMAFMGTIVTSGRGKGVVVATGIETVIGRIARQIKEEPEERTPLQKKIDRFANFIGIFALFSSLGLFIFGLLSGHSTKEMFLIAIAASVAAIPEGLPVVVTIALAIGVKRMARYNAIIRRLPSVETLGSTTVIGSDKTGTLTKNEMTVVSIYDGREIFKVGGVGYDTSGMVTKDGETAIASEKPHIQWLLRVGLLCNESSIVRKDGKYEIHGDPTEVALVVSAMKGGLDPLVERERFKGIFTIPFESERGYMATLHEYDSRRVILVKGAPERVLSICVRNSFGEPLKKEEILEIVNEMAKAGQRVLAFAYRITEEKIDELRCKELETCDEVRGLTFAGLQGMIDPPRPEAKDAIENCKKAGIRVVMITGDHALTAKAVAESLGIAERSSETLEGKDLEVMSDSELLEKVKYVSVYARVSPEHKLRIVEQLKRRGEIVAVTGDGVNDAPALKAAHIGVAMGKSGTDVAKEAADMILTDDNFVSIFHAVREGRVVFDNIRKVIFFLIPTGVASIISIAICMLMGLPVPYLAAQLLWVNLVTNGLQDVALAFEPGEKNVLLRPPRDPKEGIMSRLLMQRTLLVGGLISLGVVFNFKTALDSGYSLEKARTLAVTTMVFFQFFQAWNSRSETESIFKISPLSNPFLFFSLISSGLAQILFIYSQSLNWFFRTERLSLEDWYSVILVSASVILLVEVDKFLRRRFS